MSSMRRVISACVMLGLASAEAPPATCVASTDDPSKCINPTDDVTSLMQKKIHVHKGKQGNSETFEEKTQGMKCRIIGPGSGGSVKAEEATRKQLIAERCTEIDWDGDNIAPNKFTGALLNLKEELPDVVYSLHCVLSDCGANPGWGVSPEDAIKTRIEGGAYTAPGVVPLGAATPSEENPTGEKGKLDIAREAITPKYPNALAGDQTGLEPEQIKSQKNFIKYTELAVADHQNFKPQVVFFQFDNDRAEGRIWDWVSLAEYCVLPMVPYVFIDNAGNVIEGKEKAMETYTMLKTACDGPAFGHPQGHELGAEAAEEEEAGVQ